VNEFPLRRIPSAGRQAGQIQMDEQRKYAILFAATILAARKLNNMGSNSSKKKDRGNPECLSGFPRDCCLSRGAEGTRAWV
jgi:hypothetical protein